jgi:hypothetical protein
VVPDPQKACESWNFTTGAERSSTTKRVRIIDEPAKVQAEHVPDGAMHSHVALQLVPIRFAAGDAAQVDRRRAGFGGLVRDPLQRLGIVTVVVECGAAVIRTNPVGRIGSPSA